MPEKKTSTTPSALHEQVFLDLYKNLNTEQKKAVDTIDGPVMVIAGPGTGKTSILTLRIAQILRMTDTPANAILALTFTESGVRAMRKKLITIIGPRAYEVKIHTFHGFCNEIIRLHPERFSRIIGGKAIDEVEQVKIIEGILNSNKNIRSIRPLGDPAYYVRPIISAIQELKREYISPKDFIKLVSKQEKDFEDIPDKVHASGKHQGKMKGEFSKLLTKIEKNKELSLVYEEYEEKLRAEHFYDYNDMILEVIRALKEDEEFLLELQESHQYLLADEHQDANQSQNTLLELLSGFFDVPNLFIVGDEKQAIFRFQGASLDNFLYFKKRFPQAVLIQLKHNYRSNQGILDTSHELISKNKVTEEGLRVELVASRKEKDGKAAGATRVSAQLSPILFREYQNEAFELRHIGEEIALRISQGEKASEIAVLYRENREAEAIAKSLRAHKVPFQIHSDVNLFEDEAIYLLLIMIKAVLNPHSDEFVLKHLLSPFTRNLPNEVLVKWELAKKERSSLAQFLLKQNEMQASGGLSDEYQKLVDLSKRSISEPLIPFLEDLIQNSGLLNWIVKGPQNVHRLRLTHVFLGLAQSYVSNKKNARLADFMEHVRVLEEHGLMIKNSGGDTGREEVHLMTAHRSKGLEFDVVYITRLVDKLWGNNKSRKYFDLPIPRAGAVVAQQADDESGDTDDSLEDERRLFYVALTRARNELILSCSATDREGKENTPSIFLSELKLDLLNKESVRDVESKYQDDPAFLLRENRPERGDSVFDQEYIRHQLVERGFSVTAINNYIACPWKFFFANLVRIPEGQNFPQMYGTAIHETLRRYIEAAKKGNKASPEKIAEWYKEEAMRLPFSERDLPQVFEKGEEALIGYIKEQLSEVNENTFTEYSIRGVELKISEEITVPLTGKLDRIEIVSPGKVNVYDYKTGKPKSRNDIEGKTKTSDGNYKRQLVFYDLLLGLEGKNYMNQGILDFIEPDDSGKYRREAFIVEQEEVEALVQKIKEITSEIYTGDFMKKGCGEKDCEFCRLADVVRG
jgi:DNA helicase-2/ATP-dependent DNA helicase PcrA